MKMKNAASIFFPNQKFLSPEKTIESIGIKEGDRVADFGAGVGFWSFPLAKKVKNKGKVYVLSSNKDFSKLVENKSRVLGIHNIEVIPFELESGKIKIPETVDYVMMINVLHVIRDNETALKRAKDLLKKEGRLIVVDFLKVKTLFGPPLESRASEEDIILLAEKVGLKFKCTIDAGFHHFGLVFSK